jgi:hypothetical protein
MEPRPYRRHNRQLGQHGRRLGEGYVGARYGGVAVGDGLDAFNVFSIFVCVFWG